MSAVSLLRRNACFSGSVESYAPFGEKALLFLLQHSHAKSITEEAGKGGAEGRNMDLLYLYLSGNFSLQLFIISCKNPGLFLNAPLLFQQWLLSIVTLFMALSCFCNVGLFNNIRESIPPALLRCCLCEHHVSLPALNLCCAALPTAGCADTVITARTASTSLSDSSSY